MGVNFRLQLNDKCPACGRGPTKLHIGKSAVGWAFNLRVYPDRGINELEDWLPRQGNLLPVQLRVQLRRSR